MQDNTDTQPWYKQFWPWFLMAPLFVTIILSSYMLYTAFTNKGSMVSDQYYKEGLAINAVIDDLLKAKQLGIQGALLFQDERLTLELTSKHPLPADSIQLQFYHPTNSDQDRTLTLLSAGNGRYVSDLPVLSTGKWYVDITGGETVPWRLKNSFHYPVDRIVLTP